MLKIFLMLGSNDIVTGIASLCGIIGFVLTVFVAIRTSKIGRILRYNEVTTRYNRERTAFLKSFDGHRTSILEDNIKTDKILKDILKQVEEYRAKFGDIMTVREKVTLIMFSRLLRTQASKANWNSICNYLARLSGRLSKKEEKKNG